MDDDFIGEPDESRETTELRLIQSNPDPVPCGEPGDYQQAHPLGDIDIGRRRRIFQLPVRVRHLFGGHSDAAVGDVNQDTAGGQRAASDADRHIR
ncbi:MAG TPA: hypothetical protein VEH31_12815, partial [Streptosporangiaceae bacterium]|nr:hypothetical protein [Streptosporangiaceae bacterium]